MVCKSLFNLACNPPKEWKALGSKIKVQRRDREQSASGALASALYSAAFQLQAANTRAAGNHVIQSSGATITKSVQRKIWDVQPPGIHPWISQPCNVHDEILCVTIPEMREKIKETVDVAVESFRPRIPMIKMEWHDMKTWADK
jgi:DNA polymerase I-like protein with 3'-5' exonuclease and polymerase domains